MGIFRNKEDTEISPAKHRLLLKVIPEWQRRLHRFEAKEEAGKSLYTAKKSLIEKSSEILTYIEDIDELKDYLDKSERKRIQKFADMEIEDSQRVHRKKMRKKRRKRR